MKDYGLEFYEKLNEGALFKSRGKRISSLSIGARVIADRIMKIKKAIQEPIKQRKQKIEGRYLSRFGRNPYHTKTKSMGLYWQEEMHKKKRKMYRHIFTNIFRVLKQLNKKRPNKLFLAIKKKKYQTVKSLFVKVFDDYILKCFFRPRKNTKIITMFDSIISAFRSAKDVKEVKLNFEQLKFLTSTIREQIVR